jgi:5-methylcytosine-specific restriction endonuclease McrA
MLRDGRLSLATAALVGSKLMPTNADQLLKEVAFWSKREVEVLLAKRNPRPPVPSVVRKLPETKLAPDAPLMVQNDAEPALSLSDLVDAPPPPSRRPIIAPLSDAHYKLQVTISAAARERLGQIQDLMRHKLPSGDPAAIVEHALEVLHEELLKKKAAEVIRPRAARQSGEAKGRHIPASVRRTVWRRDQGRCAFVAGAGRRCGSTSGVEFHHVQPFAVGGAATVANIQMRCRAHNGFEWERHLDAETETLMSH